MAAVLMRSLVRRLRLSWRCRSGGRSRRRSGSGTVRSCNLGMIIRHCVSSLSEWRWIVSVRPSPAHVLAERTTLRQPGVKILAAWRPFAVRIGYKKDALLSDEAGWHLVSSHSVLVERRPDCARQPAAPPNLRSGDIQEDANPGDFSHLCCHELLCEASFRATQTTVRQHPPARIPARIARLRSGPFAIED